MRVSDGSEIRSGSAVLFAALAVLSCSGARAEFRVGPAINIGSVVNSSSNDSGPKISPDGLSLYFASERAGGQGGNDIWVSNRADLSESWGTPANLGGPVNTSAGEVFPSLSADELMLYFSDHFGGSVRAGGAGGCDIWLATRATKQSAWDAPVNLVAPVNSSNNEVAPCISSDGLTLYFASDRAGGSGSWDIWKATRPTTGDSWGTPTNLGPAINSSSFDGGASVSSDELALFFSSSRAGGSGGNDIWVSRRAVKDQAWGAPWNLGPLINSTAADAAAGISADGSTLLLDSVRAGGSGASDLWQVSIRPIVDFSGDWKIDFVDFCRLGEYWRKTESSVDIAPAPMGDGVADCRDLAVLAGCWLGEYTEPTYIRWLGHASVKIWRREVVIYVDPRNLSESPHDATLVLVTHSHGDHYSAADIAKVSKAGTEFIAPGNVVALYGSGQVILPGQTVERQGVPVTAVAAYNLTKPNHPKANNWVGYIIQLGSQRIYCAGDTDLTDEMKALEDIDVAILPVGGTYTMNADEAAQATSFIKPKLAIPYHWGDIVGTITDAQRFAALAACDVKIMTVGEVISSESWKHSPPIAHWKLDETAGNTASDSAGDNHGILHGDPIWQPGGGKVDGAIELDGVDDYVSTDFVLNPADGEFSVFAWVKGGSPGEVITSQITASGRSWLLADSAGGRLMTDLRGTGRGAPPLYSEFVITDGDWHRIGLVWDGSHRVLYGDGMEVGRDSTAQAGLIGAMGGLYFGAANDLGAASFFDGLIDDIRIYDRVMAP